VSVPSMVFAYEHDEGAFSAEVGVKAGMTTVLAADALQAATTCATEVPMAGVGRLLAL
jgi:hypothetical protein